MCFLHCLADHRNQHSFPTRRSSDLNEFADYQRGAAGLGNATQHHHGARSEEHTSELQSRQYLVCCLLLEKKNTTPFILHACRIVREGYSVTPTATHPLLCTLHRASR